MEGPLSKWTNVVKGWQYRWFVLDDNTGLLSYYTVSTILYSMICQKVDRKTIFKRIYVSLTWSVGERQRILNAANSGSL